jgi:predicted DNA-binding helix-hairpin-helix protein
MYGLFGKLRAAPGRREELADYLLRGYGFRLRDLVFDAGGNLPAGVDPKTAYAMANPARYPVSATS